jgi:hypothetical protein
MLEKYHGCYLGPKHIDPCHIAGIDISWPMASLAWYGAFAFYPIFFLSLLVTITTWNKLKE